MINRFSKLKNNFLRKLFGRFSCDIGIDLGTANTLVFVRGEGIVIDEPSVVAVNKKTGQVLAIGVDAKRMVGKTPGHIVATRPLVDGVINDFEVTEQMLKYFIGKVTKGPMSFFVRPRVLVGVPSGVTAVEKRAVIEAAIGAGAHEVYLIDEPMAAAVGAQLAVTSAGGNMVVDIGGGTSEIAVISLGGVVTSKSLRTAGDEMNEDIVRYARDHFNLLVGERTAEEVKIAIGCAVKRESDEEERTFTVRGRDLVTGLPKEIVMNDEHARVALAHSVRVIVNAVKTIIEETPPELISDIMQQGIVLAGGGSLIRGLDRLVADQTDMPVRWVENPLIAVAAGTGIVLEDLDTLRDVLLDTSEENTILQ